jgi:hypothetical protein
MDDGTKSLFGGIRIFLASLDGFQVDLRHLGPMSPLKWAYIFYIEEVYAIHIYRHSI